MFWSLVKEQGWSRIIYNVVHDLQQILGEAESSRQLLLAGHLPLERFDPWSQNKSGQESYTMSSTSSSGSSVKLNPPDSFSSQVICRLNVLIPGHRIRMVRNQEKCFQCPLMDAESQIGCAGFASKNCLPSKRNKVKRDPFCILFLLETKNKKFIFASFCV